MVHDDGVTLVRRYLETAVPGSLETFDDLFATDYVNHHPEGGAQDARVREAAELLKVGPDEMIERLAAILDERRKLEKQLADAKRELALGGGAASDTSSAIRDLGPVKLFARTLAGRCGERSARARRDAKRQLGSGVVAIIGVSEEGKAGLVVGVTDDLTGTYNAVELARAGAEALGGKGGGGRPDLAQAGGPDGARADAALDAIAARITGGAAGRRARTRRAGNA